MVQFDKLRLSGFKSFVDPTELTIEPGMTGIVGPNGCGKSNLVEAMKWVMGETSAKQMRGSEMEDVIFSGTGTRPARNIAEVTLQLDNKTRTAPAMANTFSHVVPRRGAGLDRPESAVAAAEYVASIPRHEHGHNAEMSGNLLCEFILARTEDGDGIGPCAKALTALEERGKWDSERVQKVMQTCVHAVSRLNIC